MRKCRFLAVLLTMAMLLTVAVCAGAMKDWDGRNASGVITAKDGSPVTVEQAHLIFDVQGFPRNVLRLDDETKHTDGFVTTEYTFHNPTEETVTVGMLFPFGQIPSYRNDIDFSRADTTDDLSKYTIRVDGNVVDATLRHSYFFQEPFLLQEIRPRLSDGWAEDPFYDPEMTITKYTYQVLAGDSLMHECLLEDNDKVQLMCSVDPEQTRVYLDTVCESNGSDGTLILKANYRGGHYRKEGRVFFLYVIGQPLKADPVWSVHKQKDESQEIDVPVELVSSEQITLKELFCQTRNPEGEVSESDWYNAVLYRVKQNDDGKGYIDLYHVSDVSDSLMRWYEYELTFEPGQRLVNSIKAVIYPAIDEHTNPSKYEYTYLLSLEQAWPSFGDLNITVNTPFYMLDSSPDSFEKTDSGYRLSLDGLPEGELKFKLCAVEHPGSSSPTMVDYYNRMIGPALWFLVKAGAIVSVLAFLWNRFRKKLK